MSGVFSWQMGKSRGREAWGLPGSALEWVWAQARRAGWNRCVGWVWSTYLVAFTSLGEGQVLPSEHTGTCWPMWGICGGMLMLLHTHV